MAATAAGKLPAAVARSCRRQLSPAAVAHCTLGCQWLQLSPWAAGVQGPPVTQGSGDNAIMRQRRVHLYSWLIFERNPPIYIYRHKPKIDR